VAVGSADPARLLEDSLINGGGFIVSALVGLILVPVMLKGLGAELYGVWIITQARSGWGSAVLDAGLSWAIVRQVAGIDHRGHAAEAAQFVMTAANLYFALAAIGAALIIAVSLPMTHALKLPRGLAPFNPRRKRVGRSSRWGIFSHFIKLAVLSPDFRFRRTYRFVMRRIEVARWARPTPQASALRATRTNASRP
jgi:hypothetical protein